MLWLYVHPKSHISAGYIACAKLVQTPNDDTPMLGRYLAVHMAPVSEIASLQHYRSAASHLLTVPPHRRITYDGRAFAVAGPSTWNSLPKRLRDPSFITTIFGRLLKKVFLRVLVHPAH